VSLHDVPEPLPALLGELSPEDQARLLSLWNSARSQQRAELERAMERIIQGVPAVFRGTVRKILR